jgi:translation initiation factor IF-1
MVLITASDCSRRAFARPVPTLRNAASFAKIPKTENHHEGGGLSKEDSIEVTGTILEKFPSGLFSVQLEHDRVVLAHLAGRLRRNRIRVLAGDKVTLELSPYDLTKGRITFRHR